MFGHLIFEEYWTNPLNEHSIMKNLSIWIEPFKVHRQFFSTNYHLTNNDFFRFLISLLKSMFLNDYLPCF
jgi:hypothetical protein